MILPQVGAEVITESRKQACFNRLFLLLQELPVA